VRQIYHSQRGIAAAALFVMAGAACQLGAQSPSMLSGINPVGQNPHGLQLYNVTGFAGWTSMASPQQGLLLPFSGAGLGSDTTLGGGASLGWVTGHERTRFAIRYSGGYDGEVRYTQWNAFYHFLSMSVSRKVTPKLTLNLSAASSVSNYNQLLFSPTTFGSLVAAPGSFDDLSAAVLSGQYNNDQLASLLTGAPVIDSPSRTVFFGNRVFTSSAGINLGYARTPRLSFGFTADYGYEQHLADANSDAPKTTFLLPHASYGMAGLSVSYALSRHTHIGLGTSSGRSFSGLQQSYTNSANIFLGHEINSHWFMQANAGAGFAHNVHAQPSLSTLGARPSFGAKLGYRTFSNTFIGNYERMLTLAYGAGASDTTVLGGGWRWWRPGHTWGVSASGGDEILHNKAFSKVSGYRGTFGITKQLGNHAVVEAGYSYGAYSGGVLATTSSPEPVGSPIKSHQHTVRLTLAWYPQSLEKQ